MSKRHQTIAPGGDGYEGSPVSVPNRAVANEGFHGHGEGSNDHLASIYDRPEDQFEAVVPFVEEGLERGEKCIYVADDNSPAAVLDALREGGIDVDAATEAGALTILTKAETYLRTGEFEQSAMLEFWREALEEARDESGYAGVRAAAEMTWALDAGTSLDRLVEYEAMLNTVYADEDYVVLCQYNRDRFPADVLADVIRSHPRVVYDGTVCRNVHYRPPEEFLAADRPPMDVDRMVAGLVSRARTRSTLDARERELHARLRQQEVVAELSQRGLAVDDVDRFLGDVTARVAETLEADYCKALELRPGGEELLLREGVGWQDGLVGEATVGTERDSQAGYTLLSAGPVIVEDLDRESRFSGPDLLVDHGVTSGISVVVGTTEDPWGVLGVHTRERRDFTAHDAAFVQSVAGTVATAIERAERERSQRRLYDVTSSPDLSFEEKLQALFDLGRERFDMDVGAIARIDPRTDLFEVEYVGGEHDDLIPGARVELSETYCRLHSQDGGTTGVEDPAADGLADTVAYDQFGVRSYLGTRIPLEDDLDRTCFFVSSEPRTRAFTSGEHTFLHLMGQWVQHELERQQYQRKLEESNERLEQFAYAASHDLREPLRMVSSYLRLVEDQYVDELDEDAEEFIDFAVDGADRMMEMIEALLEYSRVETQGAPLEPIDLEAVFEDALTDLQFEIAECDAEITVGDLPRVVGDPSQLRQVFQNLLDNAIEYSGEGPPRIRVSAERRGSWWRVAVRDEGIGIDPEDQDRIFEVFQRLHSREEHAGTGIGLALCQRIVERHGGELSVESSPGEGTTFSFALPAADGRDA